MIDTKWALGIAISLLTLQLGVFGSIVGLYSRIATIEATLSYLTTQQQNATALEGRLNKLEIDIVRLQYGNGSTTGRQN